MGDRRGAYRVLMGSPEGKKATWKTRCKWEDNIKMDLQVLELAYGIDLARMGTGGGLL
jgi:hypothetical protein